MKFKKVDIKNFMSIGEATLDLDKRGLVLIDGKNLTPATTIDTNGTGKSSMLSSIFYALYGEMPNGDKADSVINSKVGKDTSVTLEFETDSGDYKIVRTRKKNSLKLFSGEDELTKGTIKETQSSIDSIVGIPKDIYMSTLYFDGHNSVPFSMLTDKQRKEYLEILFNVGIYREAHEQTKLDIASKQSELADAKRNIEASKTSLGYLEDNIQQVEESKSGFEEKLLNMNSEISKAEEELAAYEKESVSKLETYNSSIEAIDHKILELSSNGNNYSGIQNTVNDMERELSNSKSKFERLTSDIKEKAAFIKSLSSTEVCLVCGNPIDEEHKLKESTRVKEEIKSMIEPYNILKDSIADLESKLPLYTKQLTDAKSEFENKQSSLTPLYEKKQSLNKDIDAINMKLSWDKESIGNKISYRDSEVNGSKSLDSNLNRLKDKKKDLVNTINDSKNKEEDIVSSITSLNGALKAFSDKGIKSHVLDLVTPEMNIRTNNYLSYLTGGTIVAEFSTQTEKANGDLSDKFDIKVTNNGKDTTYSSLSSGEQRRVDIAISLTLQDILMSRSNTSSNLLIYDELFESLDAVGSESVVELLKTRLESANTILVVTHNENLKPLFDSSIVAVKEPDGITHIENGVEK